MDFEKADTEFYESIAESIELISRMDISDTLKRRASSAINERVRIYEEKKKYLHQMDEALAGLEKSVKKLSAVLGKSSEGRGRNILRLRQNEQNTRVTAKALWYDRDFSEIAGQYEIDSTYNMRVHRTFYALIDEINEAAAAKGLTKDVQRAGQSLERYNNYLRQKQQEYTDRVLKENPHITN